MTAGDILAECERLGVQLGVSAEGKLTWRCRTPLPALLHQWMVTRKPNLLALLRHRATWDQAEADRLLAELRSASTFVGRAAEAGRATPALATVAALCLQLGEKFCREREEEAAHGWDTLALLRDAAAQARRFAREVGTATEPAPPPGSDPSVQSGPARQVDAANLFGET
jgi:hypothetical protein